MQVEVARISPVLMELDIEVPADAVTVEIDKAYATLQKSARVRGFRPGKAPRQVLAHLYGPQVANDVVSAIVNDTLPKALSEKQVQPVRMSMAAPGLTEDERDIRVTAIATEHRDALRLEERGTQRRTLERRQVWACVQERSPSEIRTSTRRRTSIDP